MSASVADRLAALVAFAEGLKCPGCGGYRAAGLTRIECVFCGNTGKDPAAQAVLKAWRERPALRTTGVLWELLEEAFSRVDAALWKQIHVSTFARLGDAIDGHLLGPRTTATESRCPCGWSGKESEREQKMNDTLCPRCRRAEPRRDGQLKVSVAGPRATTTEGREPR